jgi:glycosyltransferase involved in cell wall biosynthesis
MKVCHLISSLLTGDGPSSGILAQVAAQPDIRSSVWSLYPPPAGRSAEAEVRRLGAGYAEFAMGRSFLDLRILPPLVRALRRERPDVLHCHLVRANLYGRLAARWAGVPVVISTLRNIEEYMVASDALSRAVRQVERRTAGWVSQYVAVSDGVREAAIRRLGLDPRRIITILNALDLGPFRQPPAGRHEGRAELGLRPQVVALGSVGRLHAQKNYRLLIEALHDLQACAQDWQCIIVGDGDDRPRLEALIAAHGLQSRVRLLGFRDDVARLLGALDIFVLPSSYEGLPRALMEAMAAGLPCVVSRVGGNAEAVVHDETGLVVAPGDRAALAQALQRLISDESRRAEMGRAGYARAHTLFAPVRMANDYRALYSALLRSG